MQGIFLKFYVSEYREHKGILLFEWLLERAKRFGFNGGTAMRAMAGFGRHGVLHEETFLELSADLPVEVSFVLSEEEAAQFLDRHLERVLAQIESELRVARSAHLAYTPVP